MKMAFSKQSAWLAALPGLCVFLSGFNPDLLAQSTDPSTPYRKFVTSSFHLPADQTLILQENFSLYSTGDVIIDGKIVGQKIENSNADGQNLSIHADGDIVINGDIWLGDGGDGQLLPSTAGFSKPLLISSFLPNSVHILKTYQLEVRNGGKGGSLYMEAQRILIRGKIRVGTGGNGIAGGHGGAGGDFALESNQLFSAYTLKAGDGGKGGNSGAWVRNGGNGGNGDKLIFLPAPMVPMVQTVQMAVHLP